MSTSTDTPRTRAEMLRQARERASLSTRAAAAQAGISQGSLVDVEKGGRTNIAEDVYRKLCAGLGLDADDCLALPVKLAETWMPDPLAGPVFLPPDRIDASPLNPRRSFDEASLQELASSIADKGVLQPVLVRPSPTAPGRYMIVAGERRWRASLLAGSFSIPVIVRDMTDLEHLELALVENIQRQQVPPMEEAEAIAKLVELKGSTAAAAATLGKPGEAGVRYVQIAVELVRKLAPEVQQAVRDGRINKEGARALTGVEAEMQRELLRKVEEGELTDGKSIRTAVQSVKNPLPLPPMLDPEPSMRFTAAERTARTAAALKDLTAPARLSDDDRQAELLFQAQIRQRLEVDPAMVQRLALLDWLLPPGCSLFEDRPCPGLPIRHFGMGMLQPGALRPLASLITNARGNPRRQVVDLDGKVPALRALIECDPEKLHGLWAEDMAMRFRTNGSVGLALAIFLARHYGIHIPRHLGGTDPRQTDVEDVAGDVAG